MDRSGELHPLTVLSPAGTVQHGDSVLGNAGRVEVAWVAAVVEDNAARLGIGLFGQQDQPGRRPRSEGCHRVTANDTGPNQVVPLWAYTRYIFVCPTSWVPTTGGRVQPPSGP
jgi:hypothetical protein